MKASNLKRMGSRILMLMIVSAMLLPLIITFVGSISKNGFIPIFAQKALNREPFSFTLKQYYTVLFRKPDFLALFWNAAIMTVPIILFQLALGAMAAYGFSAFRFPCRDALFFILIIVMILPFQATSVPNFIMLKKLNLLGSYSAVILPGVFQAFGVFLLRQFMKGIDTEYYDAAKMDGAGRIRIFFNIVLPMSKSAMASLAVISFLDCWNMVEQPLIFLDNMRMFPLSVLMSSISSYESDIAYACAVLYTVPAILVFLKNEDHLIKGISLISLK